MKGSFNKDHSPDSPDGSPPGDDHEGLTGAADRTTLTHSSDETFADALLTRALEFEALRQSEERYRDFFENAKDAIYIHDLSGHYTMVNNGGEELLGYSREEILHLTIFDVVPQSYLDQIQQSLKQKLADQAPTVYEIEVIRKDGTRVPIEVNSRLIYQHGTPIGVQGTARDISERWRAEDKLRDSEERFRTVTETASDAIIVIDETGNIELANPATQKIFGYSGEELINHNLSMLMPARSQTAHSEALGRYLISGQRTIPWEAVELPGLHR